MFSLQPTSSGRSQRRVLLQVVTALCLFVTIAAQNNLLVILTDQQRFDAIGFVQKELGWPQRSRISTPNLDRLLQEGAYFRNAYTHMSVCGPARASLMTGLTLANHGIQTNRLAKDENIAGTDAERKILNALTYDEILVNDYGYNAEYYGKWHISERKGYIYQNDVRISSGTRAWFGKYNNNGSKYYSMGMTQWYRYWLQHQAAANQAKVPHQARDKRNPYSDHFYAPDPLDQNGSTQADRHGLNRLRDGLSNTAQQAAEVIDALDRLSRRGKPFSLHVSFHSPHPPMIPTKKFYEMYNPQDMMLPGNFQDNMVNAPYSRYTKPGYNDPAKVSRWIANYFGLITEIDDWIGEILAKVDSLGITKKTLIVFSSDHGEMLGAHGQRDKAKFYEESQHVPLILRMPGTIPSGKVVDDAVSHLDLHSTFLDYTVGKTNYNTDGNTLRSNIEDYDDRDPVVVAMANFTDKFSSFKPEKNPAFMVRKGDWKLMLRGQVNNNGPDALFDLENDPYEMNNLIGVKGQNAPENIVAKTEHLKAMLIKYLRDTGHPAVDEIKRRQTWRNVPFWVGDSEVYFRDTRNDGTRTEYIYFSSPNHGAATFEIKGANSNLYSISPYYAETPSNGYQGFRVIAVTYRSNGNVDTNQVQLTIKVGGGERKVTLSPPRNIRGYQGNPQIKQAAPVAPLIAQTAGVDTFRMDTGDYVDCTWVNKIPAKAKRRCSQLLYDGITLVGSKCPNECGLQVNRGT